MADQSPLLESIRRSAGGRIDTPPPIETPDDFGPVSQGPRARKRTVEIDDDLTDALRAVNRHLETILEGDGEIPDAAIPELQRMGELQVSIVEASSPGPEAGAPAGPPGLPQGSDIQDLPLL